MGHSDGNNSYAAKECCQVRRSERRWSAMRMALAMMVREGLAAPQEGKKLASTTT